MLLLAMPFALHYFYLLGDEPSYESAWEGLTGLLGLSRAGKLSGSAGLPIRPDFTRLAEGSNACLCLYKSGHMGVATMLLLVKEASGLRALDEVEKQRRALEEKGTFSSLIGESTIIANEAGLDAVFPAGTLSKASLPGPGRPLLVKEMERYRRLYITDNETELKAAGETVSTVDSLVFQAERQKDYCEEQINTFADTRRGLDRKVAETLFRKTTAPDELEKEIETLSDVYGVMANYNLMLRDSKEQVESDLKGLEKYLPESGGGYFAWKLQGLKDFCGVFLSRRHEDFSLSLENARAAIEVVKSRIELMRSRENIALQEESLIMGIAASFIEFFVVIYYGLHIWEALAGTAFSEIPVLVKGVLVFVLSLIVAAGTHRSAKAIKGKNLKVVAAWVAAAAFAIALIAAVTVLFGRAAAKPF